MGLEKCLSEPRVFKTMPKCAILKVHLKTILKRKEKPKSKSKPSRVTIRSQIIPQPKSPRWLKKVSSMSGYEPPRNYCKVSNKYLIGHVLGEQN